MTLEKALSFYNSARIAFLRSAWIFSLYTTFGVLFLMWNSDRFQTHYAHFFFYNFWLFLVAILVPFILYMIFEYRVVWDAEFALANRRSWAVDNPQRRKLEEIEALIKSQNPDKPR